MTGRILSDEVKEEGKFTCIDPLLSIPTKFSVQGYPTLLMSRRPTTCDMFSGFMIPGRNTSGSGNPSDRLYRQ